MESMNGIFWSLYVMILVFVLVSGITYWVKRRYSAFASIAIILSLLVPLVSFVYTAQRTTGTEYEYMKEQFLSRDWLALSLTVGYVYITIWSFIIIFDLGKKVYRIPSVHEKIGWIREKMVYYWKKILDRIHHVVQLVKKKLPLKDRSEEDYEEPKQKSQ